ncbi:MAG: hypothetical protein BWY31_04505 [Lentisphaerae bacterium ADurb.Bin242]|nr:MAG: hypothetical protein BWY31_04505 [Lentisphaerae bacterium ADurb.Bin242]
MTSEHSLSASFRDPSGQVFRRDGRIFRTITPKGYADYRFWVESGLARELTDSGMIVGFTETEPLDADTVLALEELPFISYPYEWCFSQLRDAALLTLDVNLKLLEKGMILKDASAFNVSWRKGFPVFMDHGSFTIHPEGQPWQAYRQFVMHFLGPLLLMKEKDVRFLSCFRDHLDGIPIDFVSRCLPWTSWLRPSSLVHIHLHSRFQKHYSDSRREKGPAPSMSRKNLIAMIRCLRNDLEGMASPRPKTEWGDYYGDTNYSREAFAFKRETVECFCREIRSSRTIDLGANTGEFSRIASGCSGDVIAADIDPAAVETLYRSVRRTGEPVYPVLQDLSNPSPGLGLFNEERGSFLARIRGDLVLGLALLHHLRIGGNWTFSQIVRLFSETAPRAVVEFVPKEDSQVQRLLRSRPDICSDWTLEETCAAFRHAYERCEVVPIPDSKRTLLLLRRD